MSSTDQPQPRSGFVTAVAWIFIVLTGFATLIAILQNVMIALVFPVEQMREAVHNEQSQQVPALVRFMVEHLQLFFLGFFLLSAATLAASIGLLLRQNWARVAVIGIMGFGVLWNLGGAILPFLFSSMMPPLPPDAPAEFASHFAIMMNVITAFTALIGLVFAGLFVWIIKRLVSDDIRREFRAS